MFSNFFFCFFENRAVYETMWKNIIEPERPRVKKMEHAHFTLDT